jgi:hypothetical protein
MYSARQKRNIGLRDKLKPDILVRRHWPRDLIIWLPLPEQAASNIEDFPTQEEINMGRKETSSEKNWSPAFLRYETHRKRSVKQLLYCVFVVAVSFLPSRWIAMVWDTHIDIWTVGGIYEVSRWDGLRCHSMYWSRHSGFNVGCTGIQTAWWSHKSVFFQNKESRLKMLHHFVSRTRIRWNIVSHLVSEPPSDQNVLCRPFH